MIRGKQLQTNLPFPKGEGGIKQSALLEGLLMLASKPSTSSDASDPRVRYLAKILSAFVKSVKHNRKSPNFIQNLND